MQTKFSIISNSILKYFLIFAISFLWINYYNGDLLMVSLISTIITIILSYLLTILSKKKKTSTANTLKDNEKMKDVSFQLLLAHTDDVLNFFNILLKINHTSQILKAKNIIVFEDTAFIPFYNKKQLTENDLISIYKNHKYNKIIISCIDYSEDSLQLANKLASSKIYLLNEKAIYSILKKYDLYPDFNMPINVKNKFRYRDLKQIAFTKANSKQYFLSGIVIFITSFFIRYNIYYLIFTTMLFIFAGISFFKSQEKIPNIADEI